MAAAPDDALVLTPAQRSLELARPWVLLAIYVALGADRLWWLAAPVAAATCFAAFVQMHDAIHGSLGLRAPGSARPPGSRAERRSPPATGSRTGERRVAAPRA